MRGHRVLALAAIAAATVLVAGCGTSAATDKTSEPDTLVLASIPSENATSLETQFGDVIKVIEKATGKKVEFQNATDYAAVIEGMRAGKIQIASFGPFSYITAKDSGAGVAPLGALVDSPDEEPGYKSYGIVPADSDITSLADYKGKNVCFVDPTSTSGYLYPSAGLLKEGVDPVKDITATMAGGHDASALAVANGQCDAGFAFDTMVDSVLVKSGQLEDGQLKVIWKSEIIPGSPVAMSTKTLSKDTQDKLTDAFKNKLNVDAMVKDGICSSAADCTLPEESTWGYTPVTDKLYDGVRNVCDITKSESCTNS